jgi:hypothetical protein
MSYQNGKSYTDFRGINLKAENGCIRFEDVVTAPTSATGEFLLYVDGGVLYFDNGSSAVAVGAAGGSVGSLDGAYDGGSTITVNSSSVVMNGVNQDTAVLALNGDGDTGGALLAFTHTTATRNDILGTASSWAVTGQGKATFDTVYSANLVAAASSNVNLAIDAAGSGTIVIGGVSTGAVTITPALTAVASVTITGAGGSTVFTVTAGDVVLSDGSVAITDADNASSLTVINNTATTIGAATNTGLVEFASTSLTTGTLLHLELTEGTLNGGHYLKCWDITAGAQVFGVAEDGATTIAGVGGSTVLTITAGDMVMSDGSVAITDADNAATFSVTNNTATSASVVVLAGSGVFTGSTTTSWMTITPSGLTTGTAVYLPVAALTTGKAVHVVANAVTSGIAVHIASSAASTQLTGAGRLLKVDHTGNATGSGIVAEVNSAAADETIIFQVAASAAITGSALKIDVSAMASGNGLLIAATEATLTTGKYINCYDGAASDFTVAKYGATVIAGNASGTAALTLTKGDIVVSDGTFSVSGLATLTAGIAAKVIFAGTETIAAAGTSTALDLAKTVHYVDADAGGDTFTLADGVEGQIMTIAMASSTGVATITPTNLRGGTSVTFNAAGDSVVLQFIAAEWNILGGNSYGVS